MPPKRSARARARAQTQNTANTGAAGANAETPGFVAEAFQAVNDVIAQGGAVSPEAQVALNAAVADAIQPEPPLTKREKGLQAEIDKLRAEALEKENTIQVGKAKNISRFPKPMNFKPPNESPSQNKRYCQKYCYDLQKWYNSEMKHNADVTPIDAFSITSENTFDFVQNLTRKSEAAKAAGGDTMTMAEVCSLVESRYAPGVFLEQSMRKKLLTGGIRQNPKKNVAQYYVDFMNAIDKAQVLLDEPSQAVMFLQGLVDPLQLRCQVGHDQKPFQTLQSIYEHALGAELEVQALKNSHGVRVHVMRSQKPEKRRSAEQGGSSAPKKQRSEAKTVDDWMKILKNRKGFGSSMGPGDLTPWSTGDGKHRYTLRELAEMYVEGKCTKCQTKGHISTSCPTYPMKG